MPGGVTKSHTDNEPGEKMKRIGLIGGLSPESTVHYYQILCREYNRSVGGLNFPEIVIESINLQSLVTLFGENDWDGVAKILLTALNRLKDAGADFSAILANTPHNAYDQIRDVAPLEILTIMDATAAALKQDRRKTVALLGTKPTMEFGFFQKTFAEVGIETLVPEAAQRTELDRIVWEELSHGITKDASREAMKQMIADLEKQGVEAVILGCTELSLLIQDSDTPLPLYDTTRIHAEAILEYALQEQATDTDLPNEPFSPVCYMPDFTDEPRDANN
jgi:aspartate racemase